jgi:SAM-dependent methyltransferase
MSARAADTWSASEYNKIAPFVYSAENTVPIVALLDPKPGEKIIDFGCGSGEITLKLSKVVTDVGIVVGVDSSPSMASTVVLSAEGFSSAHLPQVDKAKENGLEGAFVQDIQALDDDFVSELLAKHGRFDKVFSNAVLHWCKRDPVGVIRSVKKVLKPGGSFAAEFGGWGNCAGRTVCPSLRDRVDSARAGVRSALHSALGSRGYDPIARDPWYFPSTESYSKVQASSAFMPFVPVLTLRGETAPGFRGI